MHARSRSRRTRWSGNTALYPKWYRCRRAVAFAVALGCALLLLTLSFSATYKRLHRQPTVRETLPKPVEPFLESATGNGGPVFGD